VHPDGNRIITLISGVPFYAENGTMTEALIVLQDITAQKSLEQHKTEFLWMANHELRTPITIIQGFAELLKARDTSLNLITGSLDEFTLNALDNIIEQCDQLERLIAGMYDISSIEQQQFSLHPAKHDMLQLLIHLIDNIAVITRRYRLKLVLEEIQRTDTLPGIFDARRMIQVISNLINNAIKYSPQGSGIEIGLCPLAQVPSTGQYREVLIWVKDQGMGIAPRDLPHIFDHFHRSSALDPSISGLGIGLYVVKEVVTLHGGRVWAESTQGRGSTFYVSLPLDLSLDL